MSREFTVDELISVAKRENNSIRSYLYVNPIQGKHIPVSPSLSLELFSRMAALVEDRFKNERVLLIGFAETATAIGAAIACKARNVAYYLNTTRENVPDSEYLFFTESHSHATEQRLVKNGLSKIIPFVDRIVFAEDEVTTGRTIEKLVNALKADFDCSHCRFGIISILNSMPEDRLRIFEAAKIACTYIFSIPSRYRTDEIREHDYKPLARRIPCEHSIEFRTITERGQWNSRIVCKSSTMRELVNAFADRMAARLDFSKSPGRILILGTEEFMFPAMLLGKRIEQKYPESSVRFHATTRSPIEISEDEGYPLYNRSPLLSFYEKDRKTFIYNLDTYNHVVIVTDAKTARGQSINSLLNALASHGNRDVTLIRWEA